MKKYSKGNIIRNPEYLIEIIYEDKAWLFLRDRPVHPSIIGNMTLNTVMEFLKGQSFREAKLNKED